MSNMVLELKTRPQQWTERSHFQNWAVVRLSKRSADISSDWYDEIMILELSASNGNP